MPLTKPAIITVIPAVEAVTYQPASLTCEAIPPPVDTGSGTDLPPPVADGDLIYLYVPTNPSYYVDETRTPSTAPAPAGYVCDIEPQLYYVEDPFIPGALTPVYEIHCYWTYP